MKENWTEEVNPKTAYNAEKTIVRQALKEADFTDIKFSNGHYYFSGFATKNNKVIYFSIPDVRYGWASDGLNLLIRTAKDYKDYTGGSNNYSFFDVKDIQELSNKLVS